MAIYKKNNRWYIDYYLPSNKRRREVVTIPGVDPSRITRQDALKALHIRKAQIAEGKFDIVAPAKPIIFDRLMKRYLEEYSRVNKAPKSFERDVTSSKSLLRYFGGKSLTQITVWLVEKYKSERQKDITRFNRAPAKATINRELALLKNMFTKAVEWNLATSNPVKKVKLFIERPMQLRVLDNREFNKLYNSASDFLKPVLIVAINTGMRLGEILRLKWQDVNFKDGFIAVWETKNHESRNIPINKTLKDALGSLRENSSSEPEYLFCHPDGKPVKSIKKAFWGALRRAEINKCRFHDLRHTFATRLVMAGVDIVTVKELMGHKDIRMTMRYSHPTPEHKKQAVERLKTASMDTYLDTEKDGEVLEIDVTY